MNLKIFFRTKFLLSLSLLLTITFGIMTIGFFVSNLRMHKEVRHILDITKYSYIKFYSLVRENRMLFDFHLKNLDNENLTPSEQKTLKEVCTFHVEEGLERLEVAQGYDCLLRLYEKDAAGAEIYKAIKNGSYGLDTLYTKTGATNLAKLIISGYEKEANKVFVKNDKIDFLDYYTGYTRDEIAFLQELISLDIPQLTARCLYRLSLIHLFGRSSFKDDVAEPDLKQALEELKSVIAITKVKQENIFDIALIINDKFVPHAAVTIASSLLNSDLDSFYRFHIIMNPDDPLSEGSKKKLASMQYIKNYSIDFTDFPNEIIDQELVYSKMKFTSSWPLMVVYRLYLDKIFPELDSILYLDVDMVILRDLAYFKQINMANYIAAGSFDAPIMYCSANIEPKCNKTLDGLYKNSGIIFFNLAMMRDMNSSNELLKSLINSKCDFTLPDQDLLNVSFNHYLYHLAARWNHMTYYDNITPYFSYFVIHYAGNFKPWSAEKQKLWQTEPNKLNENAKSYWQYREITPWAITYEK